MTRRTAVTATVAEMTIPSAEARAEARAGNGAIAVHDRCMADWPCMNTLELAPPPQSTPAPEVITVAAWNLERCKAVEASAEVLRAAGADVVLATEMDHGMARASQRHTTRDLAALLGMGYVYGVEFVELATGDPYETSLFADVPNAAGLHGNAILSRWPLQDVRLIPLDDGGLWYTQPIKGDLQHRIGGRNAIAARIEMAGGPLTLCSVHLESESTAGTRADQIGRMLDGLAPYGDGPAVIGGDLNTNAFWLARRTGAEAMALPARDEPLFDRMAGAGYDWRTANDAGFTTRAAPGRPVRYPLMKLDWLFTRAVLVDAPRIVPALGRDGDYLSDHECVLARIALPGEHP